MTPVRLKVAYKTPESLLGELTKSVGRGGVRIETAKSLPVGTKFLFELRSPGVLEAVEVFGTVLTVSETAPGRFVLAIRYEPAKTRSGLDAVIRRILEASQYDKKRKHPRIPLHVRATESRPESPTFRLRDISLGGVGVDAEAERLPAHVKVGEAFRLQMKLTTGMLSVPGQIVWAVPTRFADTIPPRFGVSFGLLEPKLQDMLDELLSLRALPTPPWIAKVFIGTDALTP
ncbi:MAG TPA: PilZ domain-containing protein [Archangium sp.]